MLVSLIVAASENNVIGRDYKLPWHLPDDLQFFRTTTEGHPVIMGRKTFESIGKPLPNRENIVISRREEEIAGCKLAGSIEEALNLAKATGAEEAFVIGGAEIYSQMLEHADRIYLTKVHAEVDGDTFFPQLDPDVWKEVSKRRHEKDQKHQHAFTWLVFERI